MSENILDYPKMYEYCVEAYQFMLKNKGSNKIDGNDVYRGHLTKDLENHLGITTAQYSRTLNNLKEMGCVVQLRRGAGAIQSEWALITPPTFDLFKHIKGEINRMHKRKPNEMKQRIKDLNDRIGTLEGRVSLLEDRMGNG